MIGFACIVVRKDGSHFFAIGAQGFATPVFFDHASMLDCARELRAHGMNAQVVKVEYSDPVILGPKRFLATQAAPAAASTKESAS